MRIESVESLLIRDAYVIRINTDTGISGIGQTACWGYPEAVAEVIARFRPWLIGRDPLQIEHIHQFLYRMAPFRGSVLSGSVAAVDIALWDLKGKHFDTPVWQLLGGKVRDTIRLHLLMGGSNDEHKGVETDTRPAHAFPKGRCLNFKFDCQRLYGHFCVCG